MTTRRMLPAALIDNLRMTVAHRNARHREMLAAQGQADARWLAEKAWEIQAANRWIERNAEAVGMTTAEFLSYAEMG